MTNEFLVEREDQCPNCGAPDEELSYSSNQGRWFCWNCWQREHLAEDAS